jgi:NAD(P)-dependent dehydrogenase (short-subunit alcohol dehydrogenase family)
VGFYASTYALECNNHAEIEEKTMSLKDKVVLITGGGSGIGADAAKGFYAVGAKVILNGRREDMLSQTAKAIDPTGKDVAYVVGDIGQFETSHHMVALAVERFGGVDVLLNNAGIFRPRPFLDHTEEDLNGYLNLLRGYFFTSQSAIAQMRKRGVEQSSISVQCGHPMRSPQLHAVGLRRLKVAFMP